MKKIAISDNLVNPILSLCKAHDKKVLQRTRKLDTARFLSILSQQVISTNNLGISSAITSLKLLGSEIKNCTSSAVSQLRTKLGWTIFRELHQRSLLTFNNEFNDRFLWNGRRVFAVDGSKLTLPSTFNTKKYYSPGGHYRQALCTVLYQLKAEVPYGLQFSRHFDERRSALTLTKYLKPRDVVVFDRGFFHFLNLFIGKNLKLILFLDSKARVLKKLKNSYVEKKMIGSFIER